MDNTFFVTVADALGLDPTTGEALFFGKTNLTSAFELSMANTDVRGGKNNPLLFKFMHDRELTINIEQAIFGKTFLGLQVGSGVLNGAVNAMYSQCITLVAGAGTVAETPIGNLQVFKDDGTIAVITPSGKNFTVPGGGDTNVTVHYRYSTNADRISVSTTQPPRVITLILSGEVRNSKGVLVEICQIEIPSLQLDGNYTLSMTADGVSTESLKGSALTVNGATCADGDTYGYVTWIPQTSAAVPVAFIATTPSTIVASAAALPKTQQLSVYGIRGGILGNVTLTSDCTYAMKAGSDADITVGAATGLVTVAGTAVNGDEGIVVVSYDDGTTVYTDEVNVTVTA